MPLFHTQHDQDVLDGQVEYKKEKGNLLPVYKAGDRYPLMGAITGAAIGIALTIRSWNLFLMAGAVITGGVIGTLLGSGIGYVITRYKERKSKDTMKYY